MHFWKTLWGWGKEILSHQTKMYVICAFISMQYYVFKLFMTHAYKSGLSKYFLLKVSFFWYTGGIINIKYGLRLPSRELTIPWYESSPWVPLYNLTMVCIKSSQHSLVPFLHLGAENIWFTETCFVLIGKVVLCIEA